MPAPQLVKGKAVGSDIRGIMTWGPDVGEARLQQAVTHLNRLAGLDKDEIFGEIHREKNASVIWVPRSVLKLKADDFTLLELTDSVAHFLKRRQLRLGQVESRGFLAGFSRPLSQKDELFFTAKAQVAPVEASIRAKRAMENPDGSVTYRYQVPGTDDPVREQFLRSIHSVAPKLGNVVMCNDIKQIPVGAETPTLFEASGVEFATR